MKPSLFMAMLIMTIVVIVPSLPVSAKEDSHTDTTHTEQSAKHTPEHQTETQPAHAAPGKRTEAGHGEQTGHKEYPKLAAGIHKIAYFAVGFIIFVLIAVPIGAHLEKKKHPHASHH